MSHTISNYCPSSLIHRFESIPKNTSVLILGETHLADRTIFPPLPSHIKEVHIESNIYAGNKQFVVRVQHFYVYFVLNSLYYQTDS